MLASYSLKSWLLVILQFCLFFCLALLSDLFMSCWLCWGSMIIGGALGLWAVSAMGYDNFNVHPEVKSNAELVHSRLPYARIRHPMYSSLLLLCLGLLLMPFTLSKLGIFIALVMVLTVKADYEEAFLTDHFPEYVTYQARTQRFIPFVY